MRRGLWLALEWITLIFYSVSRSLAARFTVFGQDHPLIIAPGEDAALSCRLVPRISAETMAIRWFKENYTTIVHLYDDGVDQHQKQMSEYRTRTLLSKDEIAIGNVTLTIRDVRPSDSGQYTCFFQSGTFSEEATMNLTVAAMGSNPHVLLEESRDGGMQVVCTSSGWYPEPTALWTDIHGNNISTSTQVGSPNGNLQFHIITTYVIERHYNQLSCCVYNPTLSQRKQSTIHVPESFVQSMSACSRSRVLIAASFVTLGIVSIVLAAHFYQKRGTGELSKELETCAAELDNFRERRRLRPFKRQVTLDPDTADGWLMVSEDGRQVRYTDAVQPLRDIPKRFVASECVLAQEGFSTGRHYWELQLLQEGGGWSVGVARVSVNRKREIREAPERGTWAVGFWGGQFSALTTPSTHLPLHEPPTELGVYLDYEAGHLAFYNVNTMETLYVFTDATFIETVYPYFKLWKTDMHLL